MPKPASLPRCRISLACIPSRTDPHGCFSVSGVELHAVRSLECIACSERWRGRSECFRNAVRVQLMPVLPFSRHCFVWLTTRQTLDATIKGLEAAWRFFSGTVQRVVLDNFLAAIAGSGGLEPRHSMPGSGIAGAQWVSRTPPLLVMVRKPRMN